MIHVISSSQPATSVLKVVSTHLLKLGLFMVHSIRQRCCSSIKQHLYAATPIVVCFDRRWFDEHCGFCVPNAECVDVSLFVVDLALSSFLAWHYFSNLVPCVVGHFLLLALGNPPKIGETLEHLLFGFSPLESQSRDCEGICEASFYTSRSII